MKSTLSFLLLMFSLFSSAQDKIEAELLLHKVEIQTPKVKIISCGGSIFNENPLYIIDGVPMVSGNNIFENLDAENILAIDILKDVPAFFCDGAAVENGIVLITTTKGQKAQTILKKKYPFKVYDISNTNWTIHQDIYNSLSAKVPGLKINSTSITSIPKISMRGDDNTIVIVDGVRYDTSILNTINPANIQSVKVSNNPSALNYFTPQ